MIWAYASVAAVKTLTKQSRIIEVVIENQPKKVTFLLRKGVTASSQC